MFPHCIINLLLMEQTGLQEASQDPCLTPTSKPTPKDFYFQLVLISSSLINISDNGLSLMFLYLSRYHPHPSEQFITFLARRDLLKLLPPSSVVSFVGVFVSTNLRFTGGLTFFGGTRAFLIGCSTGLN